MSKVKDMQELVSLSEKQLEGILGNDTNASLLWTFLHVETKPIERTSVSTRASKYASRTARK